MTHPSVWSHDTTEAPHRQHKLLALGIREYMTVWEIDSPESTARAWWAG